MLRTCNVGFQEAKDLKKIDVDISHLVGKKLENYSNAPSTVNYGGSLPTTVNYRCGYFPSAVNYRRDSNLKFSIIMSKSAPFRSPKLSIA